MAAPGPHFNNITVTWKGPATWMGTVRTHITTQQWGADRRPPCPQTLPQLPAWASCPTAHLPAPPHALSPDLAPRCLQSPGGKRAGHTGTGVRCSAWAPSAPWAAVGKEELSLEAHTHQLCWGSQPGDHTAGWCTFSWVDEFVGPVATSTMMLLPLCIRQACQPGFGRGTGSWEGKAGLPWSGRG